MDDDKGQAGGTTATRPGCAESDGELLKEYRGQRDPEVFARIVSRYGAMVFRTCHRLLRCVQDAEDATQAAFLVLARWPEKVNEDLAGWLHTVARNLAITMIRKDSRRARWEQGLAQTRPAVDPATAAGLREELDAAMGRLPARMRSALILCYLEGRTQQDAARILGTNQMMVSRCVNEGLKRLKPLLAGRGILVSSAILVAFLAQQQTAMAASPALLGSLKLLGTGGVASAAASSLAQGAVSTMFWAKVKAIAAVMFAVSVVGGGVVAYVARPEPVPIQDSPYARWRNGPPTDPNFFPIAVWMQNPNNAARYQAAGFNLYVGLWQGPTERQLADLSKHGMRVICNQNDVGLKHCDDRTIVGWMHDNEPDNAQRLGNGKGYGPPIPPSRVFADYGKMQQTDGSRPIFLGLGNGVAFDGWKGRGARRNHPEDFPEYIRGSDIVSFNFYPVIHDDPETAGKLELVAGGVTRLRQWSDDKKIVWNYIEAARGEQPTARATPRQVKAEVWMSLVRGSRGLIYYVHQFKPTMIEAALLADAEMLPAVTAINQQIQRLAPVLNSPTVAGGTRVESSTPVAIETMVKRHGGDVYVFSVGMGNTPTDGAFKVPGLPARAKVEVLGEDRNLEAQDGVFRDKFQPWDVHLYKISVH
jgi:RNA polymerase sigma factor (sigma-70 family)